MEEIRKKALEAVGMASQVTDEAVLRDARRIMARINAKPMTEILDKVPGATMADKADRIGVSRTAVWYWARGFNRPRNKAAKRLAQITGFSVAEIRGLA